MSILTKDTIITEILPHLQRGKKGKKITENLLVIIVELILYRLKTGCQWRELPIQQFYDQPYSWQSVYYHFNKWSKSNCWLLSWESFLNKNKAYLDLSSIQIDGSHTPAKRGGESVGYQGRKSCKTTNSLYISDANGVLLMGSQPQSGQHNDLYEIENRFEELMKTFDNVSINKEGLFLNGDAGFDDTTLRKICEQNGIISNFSFNRRNSKVNDREEIFDNLLYQARSVIEHSFAWMDAFKALLVRFEKKAQNWMSLNYIAFLVIFHRKITRFLC